MASIMAVTLTHRDEEKAVLVPRGLASHWCRERTSLPSSDRVMTTVDLNRLEEPVELKHIIQRWNHKQLRLL